MDPNIWGPYGWYFIHILTYNYTGKNRRAYYNLYKSLGHIIPCHNCQQHYKDMFALDPLTTILRKPSHNLIKWGQHLHNRVNERIGKKELPLRECHKKYRSCNKKIKIWIQENDEQVYDFKIAYKNYFENEMNTLIDLFKNNFKVQ